MFTINTKIADSNEIHSDNVIETAVSLKADYPSTKRIINVEHNVLSAVAAAYKTASGLAQGTEIITDCIYDISKLQIAMLIAKNDSSYDAFHRASYELARDAFLTGKLESKALALAEATGRSAAECTYAIERKLERIQDELSARTNTPADWYEEHFAITPAETNAQISEEIAVHGGKYLLKLPTGYGKTKEILEPVVRRCIKQGQKVLVISHRRSINASICTGIEGMVSYDECTSPEIIAKAKAIKVVVNSLSAAKFQGFIEQADVVIVDEASQVISHVLGGEVKAREGVWNALNFVVKKASTVVFADADIDARCVKMIGLDHTLYSVERSHSDITVKTAGLDHVRGLVLQAAVAGETVLVAIDGAKSAKALAATISKKTGIEPLVITSENAKWSAQAAFIADPNVCQHQVVIYSPVITSSLSITSGHFKKHFGLFSGQVVPSDAIQMLRRDRTAREFIVGLKTPEYSKQEQLEATHERVDAPTARAAIESACIDADIKEALLEALDFDIKPSAFEELRLTHLQDEAWLKDHIQNTLPATLINQGFSVEVLEHSDEMSKAGFTADSQGRKAVNAMAASKVLSSAPAKALKVVQVKDAGSVDEKEHFEVIRARAEEVIGRTLTEEDAKVWKEGEGEGAITRFRRLCKAEDDGSSESKVLVTLRSASQRMHDTKVWTAEDSAELFDTLNADRHAVIRMGMSIGKATTEKAKQAAVTKLMSQLGLKTKKVNGGKNGYYYVITADSYTQMLKYV